VRAGCPGAAIPAALPAPRPDPGGPVDDSLGEVRIGEPALVTQVVRNFDPATDLVVHLDQPGCGVRLLESEPNIANPCVEGTMIGPSAAFDRCVAVVAVGPRSVAPVSAALSLLPCGRIAAGTCTPSGGSAANTAASRVFRFVAAGTRPVAVIRRDADGDGDFAGLADPPAAQVSVDALGRMVDGETPVISADGRYVAFASTDAGRLGGLQILLHDTDRNGDGSYRPGHTLLASRSAPGPKGLPESAAQPSLSGDGSRVAFVTADLRGRTPDGSQVIVHDLATGTTVLASSAAGGTDPADGTSYSPVLSRDGSTVAFASTATSLVPGGLELCCAAIYVRDLGPDFGGPGTATTEVVSLPPDAGAADDASGLPAIDGDGGLTAFQSADTPLPGVDPKAADQIYARARFPDVAVSPAALSFTGQVGATSTAQTITVTNSGAGPASVQDVVGADSFVLADRCSRRTLHRGESCAIRVSFVPTRSGDRTGTVDVTTTDLVEGSQLDSVRLVGTAITTGLEVRPASLTFPKTPLGIGSAPTIITASNVSGSTISISAAVDPDDGEFLVRTQPAVGCTSVAPEGSCRLKVTFRPRQRGSRQATVHVIADFGGLTVSEDVAVTAAVVEPSFEFSPTVAQEGRVAFVVGTHFMPRTALTLAWNRGPIATPDVVTDADGSFSVPAVILRGAGAGERTLTVMMRGVKGKVTGAPLLVVQGSAQPPDFVSRD
jgi:hypothetical protein